MAPPRPRGPERDAAPDPGPGADHPPRSAPAAPARLRLLALLPELSDPEAATVLEFAEQTRRCRDPDAAQAFLRWREDARLETLLQIAARLDDADLDQLLFEAEDLMTQLLRDAGG